MTNQKLTALMLAGALALGLCGGAVLAADPVEPDTSAVEEQETQPEGSRVEIGRASCRERVLVTV